jgi:hypothetical protein
MDQIPTQISPGKGRFDHSQLAEYYINAESNLRIFEESSHIQRGIRLGQGIEERHRPQDGGSQAHQVTTAN